MGSGGQLIVVICGHVFWLPRVTFEVMGWLLRFVGAVSMITPSSVLHVEGAL